MSSHDEILRKRCERQNEGEEGGGEWRLCANRIIVRRQQKLTFYNALILASHSHVKLLSFEAFAAFNPSRQLMRNHEDVEGLIFGIKVQNLQGDHGGRAPGLG